MSVYANCKDPFDGPMPFLGAYERSRREMRAAANHMKRCSQTALTPEARKAYDRQHKAMVRLIRDWNRLEQLREADTE